MIEIFDSLIQDVIYVDATRAKISGGGGAEITYNAYVQTAFHYKRSMLLSSQYLPQNIYNIL